MTHLWLLLFLNSWLKSEAQGFGMNLIKVPNDDRAQIVCTAALLGKYFNSGEPLSGSVIHMSITSAPHHLQQALLRELHTNVKYPWSMVVKDARRDSDVPEFVLHEKPQCYFIVLENMEDEDMDDIFDSLKTNINWNPLAQFVVFLSSVEETDEEMTDIMIEILLNFMNKKIYNVNVIGQSEESNYYYGKTVFPYHPDNNCGNRVISIETLDVCDYQESEKEDDEEGEEEEEDGGEGNGDEGGEVEEEGKEKGGEEQEDIENGEGNDAEDAEAEEDVKGKGVEEQEDIANGENDAGEGGEAEEEEKGEEREDMGNGGEDGEAENEVKEKGEEDMENTTNETTDKNKINSQEQNQETTTESKLNDDPSTKTSSMDLPTISPSEVELKDEITTISTEHNHLQSTTSSQMDLTDEASNDHHSIQPTTTSQVDLRDLTTTTFTNRNSIRTTTSSQVDLIDETYPKITSTPSVEFTDETSASSSLQSTTSSDVEYIDDSNNSAMDTNLPLTENTTQSEYPKLYVEELYRALFLDKFPRDLSGCPLVAAYRPWEPYIFNEALDDVNKSEAPTNVESNSETNDTSYAGEDNEYDNSNSNNDDYAAYGESADPDADSNVQTGSIEIRLSGIEYKLIQTIGERLHISIEMQVENTNLYHLFQQLIDGDIEMVVGGIDEDPSISQYVSSTIPYHQDDLTWCVAKAQRSYNLSNFMATFEVGAWILTLLVILAASLNILMSGRYLKVHMDYLRGYFSINIFVMGIILSQAINLRPIPTCLKICLGTTFVMSLMFSNVYQSFLVSTLTTPKSSYQISHLREIYQNRMHITGSVDNVRHLNKEGEIYRYVREQFQMCYNIEECLQRTAADAKLAVAVSRQYSFYNPRIPRDDLYCFDRNENIYVYLVTMLMPKKFHLLHKINPVIQHIIESGHMQKWARDLDMRRKISEEIQRAHEEPFKSLTLAQVAGTFLFTGILWLYCVAVFILEHLTFWLVVKRKTRLKLAKLFHRKFV